MIYESNNKQFYPHHDGYLARFSFVVIQVRRTLQQQQQQQ